MGTDGKTLSTKELVRRLEQVEKRLESREIDAETVCVRRPGERKAIVISASDGAPKITVVDDESQPRAVLGMTKSGFGLLMLSGGDGKRAVDIQARPDGNSAITVCDQAGTKRLVLAVESDGSVVVSVLDQKGEPSAAIYSVANQPANVVVFPPGEKPAALRQTADEEKRQQVLDLILRTAKTEGVN